MQNICYKNDGKQQNDNNNQIEVNTNQKKRNFTKTLDLHIGCRPMYRLGTNYKTHTRMNICDASAQF